ncbi:hypothetical protein [Rhodococcus sp. NPDC004095]
MSKFKVGDKVRCINPSSPSQPYAGAGWEVGLTYLINEVSSYNRGESDTCYYGGKGNCGVFSEYLELATEGGDMPYQRRTFKQLKDSVTVKKDARWQEACDDDTQEYILLDQSFNKDPQQTQRIYDRSLVEDDPKNFVEVFKVSPEYMTREELDQFEAFKKVQKPTKAPVARKRAARSTKATKAA